MTFYYSSSKPQTSSQTQTKTPSPSLSMPPTTRRPETRNITAREQLFNTVKMIFCVVHALGRVMSQNALTRRIPCCSTNDAAHITRQPAPPTFYLLHLASHDRSPIGTRDVLAEMDPELIQRFNSSLALQWEVLVLSSLDSRLSAFSFAVFCPAPDTAKKPSAHYIPRCKYVT